MEKNNNDLGSNVNVLESMVYGVVRSAAKLVYSWNLLKKKNKCVPVPAAANPDIPEHLMIHILSRLPVKTIIRFQCVCKSWQTLITSDPLFIQTHIPRASIDPDNDNLIVRCRNHVVSCSSDDDKYDRHPLLSEDMKIAGSVHGLVCLYWCCWNCWRTVPYNLVPRIGIWNPVTHMYKDVPPPPPPPPSIAAASLKLPHQMFLTFVFDSSSKDYKVIHITNFKERNLVAAVYSCNASCWSNTNVSSSFVSASTTLLSPHGIQVNQSVYWKWKYIRNHHKANLVMSFDIKREVFSLFPGVNIPSHGYNSTLVNLEDSLACIVHSKALKNTRVDVYVFNQTVKGGSWSKMHTVGTISLPRDMIFIQCFRNGDLFFKDTTKFKTVHIDPETHQVVEGSSHSCERRGLYVFSGEHDNEYGFRYTQTFAAVTGMNTINIKVCDRIMFLE